MFKRLSNTLSSKPLSLSDIQMAQQHLEKGWEFCSKNYLVRAFSEFNNSISLNPKSANAYYARGVVQCMRGKYKKAVNDLDRAISLNPNFSAAVTERGLAWFNQKEYKKALYDFEVAIIIDPAYSTAHQNLGNLYTSQNRYYDAFYHFDLAVKLDPNNADHYLNRGQCYLQIQKYQLAMNDFGTYLQKDPKGAHVGVAKERYDELFHRLGGKQIEITVKDVMWTEFVLLPLNTNIADVVKHVQENKAYYVVTTINNGQPSAKSVYGKSGLRESLTEIADLIGNAVLELRLEQLLDFWNPCQKIKPDVIEVQVKHDYQNRYRQLLVMENDDILGIYASPDEYTYPNQPTVLFGKEIFFAREFKKTKPAHQRECHCCHLLTSYYKPVFDKDMLSDYACPQCGTSPIRQWVEDRMVPGEWSKTGFLGLDENLDDLIVDDEQQLEHLGISHNQIADALDYLLDKASAGYADHVMTSIEKMVDRLGNPSNEMQEQKSRGPLDYQISEIESLLKKGKIPPKEIGILVDNYQIFLDVLMGYQFCPWTITARPWRSNTPGTPVRILEKENNIVVVVTVPGLTIQCRDELSYRYADRDFLIINRVTGEYLKGPGLIVHLIHDHHFFEGKQSPYRVDPRCAARVLNLQ